MPTPYKLIPQLKLSNLYSFFIRNCSADFIFTGESHNFHEVVCVLKGSVSITADSEVFTLSQGSAIWHTPMEFHSVRAAEGTTPVILVFSFDVEVAPTLKRKIFSFSAADEALLTDATQMDAAVFYRKNFTIIPKEECNPLQVQRLSDTLELFLLRLLTNIEPDTQLPVTRTNTQSYTAITNYINTNLSRITCVEQIAKACGLSSIGVQKLFHKYVGIGVMHYVNHLKIARAIDLLKEGYSNKEVANQLGFSNQNYFSTVFKRITGTPPSQYIKTR